VHTDSADSRDSTGQAERDTEREREVEREGEVEREMERQAPFRNSTALYTHTTHELHKKTSRACLNIEHVLIE
jgi:hypothetical protein